MVRAHPSCAVSADFTKYHWVKGVLETVQRIISALNARSPGLRCDGHSCSTHKRRTPLR
ncbi:hypothetical protein DFP92_101448 [Yoonia sediminilitoris]|uniref:Uncharacterized protein n=1 Tax=Yoonia sediminilitoris TaxID=1286148 RepID=A0A2T6KQL5_9RHOB|nr:hypothetical protein C8N45_101448 [Yoonia sediminilitoris]RCW99025.1 hypothetical protein DFP92_101448 [Yoonia sediminilitoris]